MQDEGNDGNDRKPRIRPISRITSSPLNKLKSARCFQEIDRRLRLGWSTGDLARMVHEEFGELQDISLKYLKKLIDKYRLSIPPAELSMTSTNSVVSRNATKKVAEGLNELDEIERLYDIQMKRIDIGVSNEEKIKMLLPNTGKEVFVAMKLLKQSADLKMDLGLVKRNLGTMEVTGQLAAEVTERYGRDAIGKVISDPDSRRKVLGLAERLIALGTKAGIDAVDIMGDSLVKDANPSLVDKGSAIEAVSAEVPIRDGDDNDQG